MRRHLVIADTQIRPGVPTIHLEWIGRWAAEHKPDVIVHIGDHWDMPSLSSYDAPGSMKMEGARYEDDIKCGNDSFMAMMRGNVEAVVAIIYTTDGDEYRIHDIGRREPFSVAADLRDMLNRFT